MAAPRLLVKILNSAHAEISIIRDFAVEADTALANRASETRKAPLSEQQRKEVEKFMASLSQRIEGKKTNVQITVSPLIGDHVMGLIFPIKQRTFLAEMTLSYLISHLEAFLKDYVLQILVSNPSLLKSNSMITHEDLLGYSKMKELRLALAQSQIESLGYGSIDDIANFFSKRFNVELAEYPNWELLREHVYRRNLIVHNRGKVNDVYRKKVKYMGKKSQLLTDMHYVKDASQNLLDFVTYVHRKTYPKFSKAKRVANRNET